MCLTEGQKPTETRCKTTREKDSPMGYSFALLDPRPQGAEDNSLVFGGAKNGVLGIEITVPQLAAPAAVEPTPAPVDAIATDAARPQRIWAAAGGRCGCAAFGAALPAATRATRTRCRPA